MLERTGALVDVDSIFDEAGLYGDEDTLIAFEEFMRIFRRLRFEAIHDLLNSSDLSLRIRLEGSRRRDRRYHRFEYGTIHRRNGKKRHRRKFSIVASDWRYRKHCSCVNRSEMR
jgi:hypothetical protein